jgi:hypothetical protein
MISAIILWQRRGGSENRESAGAQKAPPGWRGFLLIEAEELL